MKIANLDNIPKTKVDMEGAKDAYKQVPISKHDGSSFFSFRVFTIEPKGYTPFHTHPFEHLSYIIRNIMQTRPRPHEISGSGAT